MTPTKRDIPPWTALTIVALALMATIVSGREQPAPQPDVRTPARAPAEHLAALDPAALKLARTLEGGLPAEKEDPLANRSLLLTTDVFPPAGEPSRPRTAPAPRPARNAPPLPFTYLAKLIDGGKTTVFVAHGPDHYSAEPGLTIDDTYKVERITDTAITFLHLPSRTRQVLAVPSLAE